MSFADLPVSSGTTSVNHDLVAALSADEPPPGTKTSEKTFKNSNIGTNFISPLY